MKDYERVFNQKLQEAKRESQNLSNIFKQLWPLIKNKVKDPTLLLKTVNGMGSGTEELGYNREQVEVLESKILQLKKREKELKEQVLKEQELRIKAEQ